MSDKSFENIISNVEIDEKKLRVANEIIANLQQELVMHIDNGAGPFLAAIYDSKGNLVVKEVNSVIKNKCSICHAEMNVIKKAEAIFETHDLSQFDLSLYVTAEPCVMCLGGIMWSGIKSVYYGVPSCKVEEITGFDEGFKPDWLEEFKKRGISVYGNIQSPLGEQVLRQYISSDKPVYNPER